MYDKILKREFASVNTEDTKPYSSGAFPAGYAKFEKPGTADKAAHYDSTNCILCN